MIEHHTVPLTVGKRKIILAKTIPMFKKKI